MSRIRTSTPLAVLTCLAVVAAACGSTTESPDASTPTPDAVQATATPTDGGSSAPSATEAVEEPVTVNMDGSDFIPDELTIAAGTEVIFVNVSEFEHTVTEGSGGRAVEAPLVDVEVAAGDSEGVTFDEPGTFEITCRIHPTMQLTITVEG